MKILQILPGKVWGGAEQYVVDLGRALTQRGHMVSYACRPADAVTRRLDAEKIPYTIVDPDRLSFSPDFDIVNIHDKAFIRSADRQCRRLGDSAPRLIFTRHIARASRVMPWQRDPYRRLAAMIFVSDFSRHLWRSVNSWMPESLCSVIHNSIPATDNAGQPTESLRSRFGIDQATPLLMFTGRIRRSKGCMTIIDALAQIDHPCAMVFVGTPKPADYDRRLLDHARRAGIADRIHFYGFTPEARTLVGQADIGVQPSIVREAFGLSMLEFMQAGKALITTDNGAQPEYIDNHRTGLLIAPDSPRDLARALTTLLRDPELRSRIGSAAADEYTRQLSYPIFIDSILNLFTRILHKS